MKRLLLLPLLLASFTLAVAQSTLQESLDRLHTGLPPVAHRITSHEDTPALCYYFDWPDSGAYWDTISRHNNTYDVNDNITEKVFSLHQGNGFQPSQRYRWTYDPQGRITTTSYASWNGSSWQASSENHMTWDSQGNMLSTTQMGWSSGAWDTLWASRYAYQYVFSNRVAQVIHIVWNETWRFWDTISRRDYHFPTAAGWDSTVLYDYNLGTWVAQERFVDPVWYDFDKGQALSMTLQQADNQGNFENTARSRCSYGTNDNSTCVNDTWSGQSWDSTSKELYRYDAHEHITLHEGFSWIGTWYQDYGQSISYVYDPLGRTGERIYQEFDGYIYRISNRMTCPEYLVGSEVPRLLTASVTASPNPCTDKFTLRWSQATAGPVEVLVSDMEGRIRVRTVGQAGAGSGEIAIALNETIPAGIYAYTLRTRQGIASGKVVVVR